MTVVSVSVRLQLLTLSTLLSETCAICIFAFWQSKNIFGRIFIVEFVSQIQITTRKWSYSSQREGGKGYSQSYSAIINKVFQVEFCYLLRSTYNSTVSFDFSAFSSRNDAIRCRELRSKISVTSQILRILLLTKIHSNICKKWTYCY